MGGKEAYDVNNSGSCLSVQDYTDGQYEKDDCKTGLKYYAKNLYHTITSKMKCNKHLYATVKSCMVSKTLESESWL